MDLDTLLRVAAAGVPVGGVVLAMAWLFFRPKVKRMIEKEIAECKETRACGPDGAIGVQLTSIAEKIDSVTGEIKYIRRRVDAHMNGAHDG